MASPKPRIWKQEGKWILRYFFNPRMMWLFGATAEERREIKARCVSVIEFASFERALHDLRLAYRADQVAR